MTGSSTTALGQPAGEYELVGLLGRGGSGTVYEARHTTLGRRAAVKVVSATLAEHPEVLQRFVAEARAVNAIRHRGIVDIFAYGRLEDGSPYLVMELLEGQTFAQLIDEQAPVPASQVITLAVQTLEVLDAAHGAGIVHRDIKPSNLFLATQDGSPDFVKVLDFGLAKALSGLSLGVDPTREGAMLGTPAYMSPEQVSGAPVTPATDVYALGLVLFELLTGAEAVPGGTIVDTLRAQLQTSPPPPSALHPGIPAELDGLVLRMVYKEPTARPSVAETLRCLRVLSEERGLSWPPSELPARARSVVSAARPPWGAPFGPKLLTPSLMELAPGHASGDARDLTRTHLAPPEVPKEALSEDAGALEPPEEPPEEPLEKPAVPLPSPTAAEAPRLPGASVSTLVASAGRLAVALTLALGVGLSPGDGSGQAGPHGPRSAATHPRRSDARPGSGDAGVGAYLTALARDIKGDERILLTIDAPRVTPELSGEPRPPPPIVSGVELIKGTAAATDGGIAQVELFVDDVPYGGIPFKGRSYSGDRSASPAKSVGTRYDDVDNSEYGALFNFSELSPGLHTIVVRAVDKRGRSEERRSKVEVRSFHEACVPRGALVHLKAAQVHGRGHHLRVTNAVLQGVAYELELAYSDELQDFRVVELTPRPEGAPVSTGCPSPAVLPGFRFRPPPNRLAQRTPNAPGLFIDDALLRESRRGDLAVQGWFAVSSEAVDQARRRLDPGDRLIVLGVRYSPNRHTIRDRVGDVVDKTLLVATGDVWREVKPLYPELDGVTLRSFLLSVRSEELPPGRHTVELRSHVDGPLQGVRALPFEVEQFGASKRVRPHELELRTASFSVSPGRILVRGATVKGERYDFELTFLTSLQRFAITSIRPASPRLRPAAK